MTRVSIPEGYGSGLRGEPRMVSSVENTTEGPQGPCPNLCQWHVNSLCCVGKEAQGDHMTSAHPTLAVY